MKRSIQLAAMAAALLTCLPLAAQTSKVYREGNAWVEEVTGTIPVSRALRVSTDAGTVNVTGAAQRDITYTVRKKVYVGSEDEARRQLARFRVSATRRADSSLIEGSWEDGHARRFSADFIIQAPKDLEWVKVTTDGGGIAARNFSGRVDGESGGGNIQVSDISGPVNVETGGGTVSVSNCPSALSLHTGGGAIIVASSAGATQVETGGGQVRIEKVTKASIETGGGDVDVRSCGGELRAATGGGNLYIGDVNGRVSLETGGGNIRLASASGPVVAESGGGTLELFKLAQGVRAETGSGAITAEILGTGSAGSSLETSAGNVVVYLSPSAKITVRAELEMANGHGIRSDFPELKITSSGEQWGPKNITAEGSLNGGGPVLRVRTMSGNIEFRRATR